MILRNEQFVKVGFRRNNGKEIIECTKLHRIQLRIDAQMHLWSKWIEKYRSKVVVDGILDRAEWVSRLLMKIDTNFAEDRVRDVVCWVIIDELIL